MNDTYSQILTSQKPAALFKDATVSPDVLAKIAGQMNAAGYVHTEASLTALDAFLRGRQLNIFGDTGCGKTSFFAALSRVVKKQPQINEFGEPVIGKIQAFRFAFISMATVGMFSKDRLAKFLRATACVDLIIDDIGAEPETSYGVRNTTLSEIIELRRVLAPNKRIHVTRNILEKEIDRRYGKRVVDRLRESTAISFGAVSHRNDGTFPGIQGNFERLEFFED